MLSFEIIDGFQPVSLQHNEARLPTQFAIVGTWLSSENTALIFSEDGHVLYLM